MPRRSADAGHDPGMLTCFAEVPSGGEVDKTRDALLKTVEEIGTGEVSEEEVKRGVAELLKRREDLCANTASLAVELSEWAAYGDWRLFFLHRDRLEKVSPSDVRRVAGDYLLPSNRTVGLFIPTKDPVRARIPEAPSVEKMVADYKGRAKVSEGEVFDTDPDNVEKRITRGQLPSGLKYAFLPKKTKGEKVLFSLNLRFGDEKSLSQGRLNDACDLIADLMVRGTKQLSFQQIQDRLRDLKTNLNQQSSTGEATFRMESRRGNFVDALQVLHQILREPTLPAAEFEILRNQSLTRKENLRNLIRKLWAIENLYAPVNALSQRRCPIRGNNRRTNRTTEGSTGDDFVQLYDQFFNGQNGELSW